MDATDAQHIANFQQGQREAFGQLYDKYIRKIYDFIYYKTHHRQTAEDLTSQTFLKALQALQRFDLAKGSFQAWLYQIARNTVIDYYRQQRPEVDIEDAWDLHSDDDLPADIDVRQQLETVRLALQKFPAEQRDVVLLRVWGELGYQEIAQIVGKSEASCKMSFSRTLTKLRAEQLLALLLWMRAVVG